LPPEGQEQRAGPKFLAPEGQEQRAGPKFLAPEGQRVGPRSLVQVSWDKEPEPHPLSLLFFYLAEKSAPEKEKRKNYWPYKSTSKPWTKSWSKTSEWAKESIRHISSTSVRLNFVLAFIIPAYGFDEFW